MPHDASWYLKSIGLSSLMPHNKIDRWAYHWGIDTDPPFENRHGHGKITIIINRWRWVTQRSPLQVLLQVPLLLVLPHRSWKNQGGVSGKNQKYNTLWHPDLWSGTSRFRMSGHFDSFCFLHINRIYCSDSASTEHLQPLAFEWLPQYQ